MVDNKVKDKLIFHVIRFSKWSALPAESDIIPDPSNSE